MNLNTCLVVILSLAITTLSLAEKFESVKCGKDEFTCYGEWNDDWTEQLTSDYCIPSKIGDCWNDCPKQCHKDEIRCPGQIDRNTGCIGPDSCQAGKFCPVECDPDNQIRCYGESEWYQLNGKWTENELTSDYCIPNKIGDCDNSCPKQCMKDEVMCQGTKDSSGCRIMADTCCKI